MKTTGVGGNRSKNCDNGGKPVNGTSNNVSDIAAAIDVNDGDSAGSVTTAPITTASGFKKNMLQRAVQAAAAAAANDNNNNDDDGDNNDKNFKNDDGDIAK